MKRSSQVFDSSPEVLEEVKSGKPDSKSIKDLQNKLIAEMQKPASKEDSGSAHIHNAGTDHLKKGFEKLTTNSAGQQQLLTAPKISLLQVRLTFFIIYYSSMITHKKCLTLFLAGCSWQ